MNNVSIGKGVRGCTPFEFKNYLDSVVYLKCQTCGYEWIMSLSEYQFRSPDICPLCKEKSYSASWIKHDVLLYEYRLIPNLSQVQLVIELPNPNVSNTIWGNPGIYKVTVYPPGVIIPGTGDTGSTGGTSGTGDTGSTGGTSGTGSTGGTGDPYDNICNSIQNIPSANAIEFDEMFIAFWEIIISTPTLIKVYKDTRVNKNNPPNLTYDVSYHNLALDYDGTWYDCGLDPSRVPIIDNTGGTGGTGDLISDCEYAATGKFCAEYDINLFTEDVISFINGDAYPYPEYPVLIRIRTDIRTNKNIPIGISGDKSSHTVVKSYTGDWYDCGLTYGNTGSTGDTGSTGGSSGTGGIGDPGDPTPIKFVPFTIYALLNDPNHIENEDMYHRDMLKQIIISPDLIWRKALLYREIKQDMIID